MDMPIQIFSFVIFGFSDGTLTVSVNSDLGDTNHTFTVHKCL